MAKNNMLIWIGIAIAALFVLGIIKLPGGEFTFFQGKTGPVVEPSTTVPLFEPIFPQGIQQEVTAGKDYAFTIVVKNRGIEGTQFVDAGLYHKETIEGWYGSSIDNIFTIAPIVKEAQTCQPETFVQNKEITLTASAMTPVDYIIKAPAVPGTYYLHAGSFKECWRQPGDEGYRVGRVYSTPITVVAEPTLPLCGNNKIDAGEECDDGNTINTDDCLSTCKWRYIPPTCGDGKLDLNEQCDDGNRNDGDGCTSTCTLYNPAACGNKIIELSNNEDCDDGNKANGDGCSSTCKIETSPTCGDTKVDTGEQCDDGNVANGDGCDKNCRIEVAPGCGNNRLDAFEQCDDGNTNDGDGCSSNCLVETRPGCGDGRLDSGEACDDGNQISGDGCSSVCEKEKPKTGTFIWVAIGFAAVMAFAVFYPKKKK